MGFLTEHIKKTKIPSSPLVGKHCFQQKPNDSLLSPWWLKIKKKNELNRKKINSDVADNEIEKITICQNLREISSSSLCRWLLY